MDFTLFIFWPSLVACGIFISQPETEPVLPAWGVQSLNQGSLLMDFGQTSTSPMKIAAIPPALKCHFLSMQQELFIATPVALCLQALLPDTGAQS